MYRERQTVGTADVPIERIQPHRAKAHQDSPTTLPSDWADVPLPLVDQNDFKLHLVHLKSDNRGIRVNRGEREYRA